MLLKSLDEAEWTKREGLVALTAALGAENIRWVGGAVRDGLLGVPVNDVDCATLLMPAEVIANCGRAGIRTVPTGIEHGTVTAILKDGPVEVTTLRRDVATDGRRATIAFAKDWSEDAARRDFTINALYLETRASGLPRTTCGSCAITASRPASVHSLMKPPKMPAPRWPTP